MNASTRAVLTTGVAALSLGALAMTTSVPPESMRTIQVVRPANFAADIVEDHSGAPTQPPSEDDLNSALALIEQLAPVADGRVVTVKLKSHDDPATVTIAPAGPDTDAEAVPHGGLAGVAGRESLEEPATQNAASDLIDGVYSVSRYWANYVSLELGPWLINWIPFGYLVSDQIYIWYPDFVLPTVDSFVYDFLDPVVNNPLDLTVWIDGIGAVLNTAATGIANGIASEVNYIVTFGWFPIPLPPLPDFPLPGLSSASASVSAATALPASDTDETDADGTEKVATEPATTEKSAGSTTGEAAEGATESTDTGTVGEGADEATDPATEDGTGEKATGENAEAPAEDAQTPAEDAQVPAEDVEEPTVDAEETPADAEEPSVAETVESAEAGDEAESADEAGQSEQSADDADGTGAQQDNASETGKTSGDSAGTATKAPASDGN